MNILILRVSAIGDIIHTFPAVHLLKTMLPKANIFWVVQKKGSSLLHNQKFIKKVWTLPDKFLRPKNLPQTQKIIKEMRHIEWDIIIDFQGIFKTSVLLFFLNGKKIGFDAKTVRSPYSLLFTNIKHHPCYTNIIQKNLALASAAIQVLKNDYSYSPSLCFLQKNFNFHIPLKTQNKIRNWLQPSKEKIKILLNPNTTWPSKHWPIENWKNLLLLISKNKNFYPIIIGEKFGKAANELANFAKKKKFKSLITPPWSLIEIAALLQNSDILIAPDTGILHLADFLGTKTIGIFGPTLAQKHGPFLKKDNIQNAIQIKCPHYYKKYHGSKIIDIQSNCMYKLTSTELYRKLLKIFPEASNEKIEFQIGSISTIGNY